MSHTIPGKCRSREPGQGLLIKERKDLFFFSKNHLVKKKAWTLNQTV